MSDYRQLLKATIRGMIYEYDVPSQPTLIDAGGDAVRPIVKPAAELPEIPTGFRYDTHVAVMPPMDGEPIGRYRSLMAVCDGADFERQHS